MKGYRKSSHAVYDMKYHVIWTTKYRYKVLRDEIAQRAKDLIIQGCQARGMLIIKGSVGKDHIHILLSCPPVLSPAKILQYLKESIPKVSSTVDDDVAFSLGSFFSRI